MLASSVREELFRGVRVDRMFKSFGTHWSKESGYAAEEEYDVSEPLTKCLDDFISHDWETSRWPKFLSLLIVYNSADAAIASMSIVISLSFFVGRHIPSWWVFSRVQQWDIAGVHYVTTEDGVFYVLGILLFIITLLFSQQIRHFLCFWNPRFAFVDKLCINQADDILKAEGIASLAGFLKQTDRLVVLWTPRYFTRLWCAYEMATWLRLGNSFETTVKFMPVSWGWGLLGWTVGLMSFWGLYSWLIDLRIEWLDRLTAVFLSALLTSLVMIHYVRYHTRILLQLPRQLSKFSVRTSECFCCSVNHVHPDTGRPVTCDREAVYSRLVEWYKRENEKCCPDMSLRQSNTLMPISSQRQSADVPRQATDGKERGRDSLLQHPYGQMQSMRSCVEKSEEEWLEDCLDAFDNDMKTTVLDTVCSRKTMVRVTYMDPLIINVACIFNMCDALAAMDGVPEEGRRRVIGYYLSIYFLTIPILFKVLALGISRSVRIKNNEKVPAFLWTLLLSLLFVLMLMVLITLMMKSIEYVNIIPQVSVSLVQAIVTILLYPPSDLFKFGAQRRSLSFAMLPGMSRMMSMRPELSRMSSGPGFPSVVQLMSHRNSRPVVNRISSLPSRS